MNQKEKPFTYNFVNIDTNPLLELVNTTDLTLRSIEVLTVFLKDENTGNGASQAHIKFEGIRSMLPKERAVMAHRTWINGKPANAESDQLGRLKLIDGAASPYVLDISWRNALGKAAFQRIPVGH